MQAFFEIPGLNIYLQIAVTILSITVILLTTRGKPRRESTLEIIAINTIGLAGWFTIANGFFGHILYADQVASGIGWPQDSGFQMELGFAAIGIGIVGFIGFWVRFYWLPFIIAKSTFMLGAALTHILHILEFENFSPGNAGLVLYWDIILPIILIGLYLAVRRQQKSTSERKD